VTSRLRVEFHCHTNASRDCLTSPQRLVEACRRKGIERVVVTDHNTIRGALRAKEIAPELVIVGEEIMTDRGELLAAYVREEIPSRLPAMQAIERLRDQEAFISVSHPFDPNRSGGWKKEDLEVIAPHIDAIETYNSRCLLEAYNTRAQEFARLHRLPGTVGSDAHSTPEIGQAVLLLEPFQDAAGLRESMRSAEAECKPSLPLVRLTSRLAILYHKIFPEKNNP
jgi:predicted metal-dependent phosphoesterase TrpH